jgi:glycosyltransferase involved in cell wall biosynthesis
VGKMDKYKNVDVIIKAFYEADIDAKLLLVGKIDNDYKKKLTDLIRDDRVISDFTFVSDSDMSAIMQAVNIIVLPYSNTSMNSGIMINAFTNGTTVVGTNIEMLMDYPTSLVYGYSHNDVDHVSKLKQKMYDAYTDYKYGDFCEKGSLLEDIVNRDNNWGQVKQHLLEVFE